MAKEITFTNIHGFNFYPPKPAIKEVPEWYKNTPEYVGENGKKIIVAGIIPVTIKKCIPVFDAMTSGYILYTQVDVQVEQKNNMPYDTWADQNAIAFHPLEQAPLHPSKNGAPYAKWNNPYSIKTSAGYSTLFISPMHNPNGIFTVLPGMVDTDSYTTPVNFPFTLNDVTWEGLIPAGTPIVQLIPIKRDSWESKIGSDKEIKEQQLSYAKIKTLFFNSYKRQFWHRKEYK